MNNRTFQVTGKVALVMLAPLVMGGSLAAWAKDYDPKTKVYCDALWFRVHAEDCPDLILKDEKKTMTLEEADRAGARIGESGQSGREKCCLHDYQRKHPEKKFTDDTVLCGNDEQRNVKHVAGCHRYWPDRTHTRRTQKEWVDDGFVVCEHCIERGPSLVTVSEEEWNKLPAPRSFVAPAGWVPKPYAPDTVPPKDEIAILVQETLDGGNGIQELQFTDPVATVEHFMTMRFFFPVHRWLDLYMGYRATGDERIHAILCEAARHYHTLSVDYPSAAQIKASDPEGLAYMFAMAASARITLQSERKHPGTVSQQEIAEAEALLETMLAVLKPTHEGSDSLDPEMGVPQAVADDFRNRAFNRAMNGIGTLAMMTAALEDLQAIKKTEKYQSAIDHYRHAIQQYLKYWFSRGHFCSKVAGEKHFYYPYAPREGEPRMVDGCALLKRNEDYGHYSHTMQGLVFLYEATPDLGVDDDFMTAVANAIYFTATNEVKKGKMKGLSGYVQCPTAARVSPAMDDKKTYSPAAERFYVLQAFRDDMLDGLCNPLNEEQRKVVNSDYDHRLATLYGQYVKALRTDRSLTFLGEKR